MPVIKFDTGVISPLTGTIISGVSPYTVKDSDLIGSGGQGSVYKIGPVSAVKIFEPGQVNAEKMIAIAKAFSNPGNIDIIVPQMFAMKHVQAATLKDVIGYTMKYMEERSPLVTIFSKDAKIRNNIRDKQLEKLFTDMANMVKILPLKGCCYRDLNEYNIMVKNKTFDQLCMIDMDGCAVDKFKVSAVMESIRDWSAKDFDRSTDWFSFAVLAFQLYTGIHPYRGTVEGGITCTLKDRITKRLSVFNPKVRVPLPAKDFRNVIPNSYCQWFESVFERGKREEPPSSAGAVSNLTPELVVIRNTGDLKSTVLFGADSDIVDCFTIYGKPIIQTASGLYVGEERTFIKDVAPYAVITPVPAGGTADMVSPGFVSRIVDTNNQMHTRIYLLNNLNNPVETEFGMDVDSISTGYDIDNEPFSAYAAIGNNVVRLSPRVTLDRHGVPVATTTVQSDDSTSVSRASFRFMDSCFIQYLMGTLAVTGMSGRLSGITMVSDMKPSYRIVSAILRWKILCLVYESRGNLYRVYHNVDTNEHTRPINTTDTSASMIALPQKGVVVATQDEKLVIIPANGLGKNIRIVDIGELAGARISTLGSKVVAMKDNILYQLSLS